MQEHSHAFLKSLVETPSASGYEQAIQEVVRSWARHYADEVRTDQHGNVIAVRHAEPESHVVLRPRSRHRLRAG